MQVHQERNKVAEKTSRKTIKESQITVKTLSTLLHFTVDQENHTGPKRHHKASKRDKKSKTITFGLTRSRIRVTRARADFRASESEWWGLGRLGKVLARSQAVFNGQ